MKLGTRIALTTMAVVVATGTLSIATVVPTVEKTMFDESRKQEASFVQVVADSIANSYFSGDAMSVQRSIDDLITSSGDIEYVYLVNEDGAIRSHTFQDGFPVNLVNANVIQEGFNTEEVMLLTSDFGVVRDVGARIINGLDPEIHVGFSQQRIIAAIDALKSLMIVQMAIWILLGSAVAALYSRASTGYLRYLANASLMLGRGALSQQIEVKGNDEIADLALSMNKMREDISLKLTQLEESEESNRMVLDAISASGEGVVVFHPSDKNAAKIHYVNEQYLEMVGITRKALSKRLGRIEDNSEAMLPHESFRHIAPDHREMKYLRSDGAEIYIETTFSEVRYSGVSLIMCVCRDATERNKSARELVQRNKDLASLNELSEMATGAISDGDALQRMMSKILVVCGGVSAWIFSADGRTIETSHFQSKCGFNERMRSLMLGAIQEYVNDEKLVDSVGPDEHSVSIRSKAFGPEKMHVAIIPLSRMKHCLTGMAILFEDDVALSATRTSLLVSIGGLFGGVIENVRLLKELQEKTDEQSRFLEKAISAQEEERKRISRELHDETSQSIAALSLGVNTAATMLKRNDSSAIEMLESLKERVSTILKELHRIEYDLRPSLLDDLGLIPALRWYLEVRAKEIAAKPHIEVEGEAVQLSPQSEIMIFRIVQEAVTNAVKYSNAEDIFVRVLFFASSLSVVVADNGHGFDCKSMTTNGNRASLGLIGMRERAELIGGTLEIDSNPELGTSVNLVIPLEGEHDEH